MSTVGIVVAKARTKSYEYRITDWAPGHFTLVSSGPDGRFQGHGAYRTEALARKALREQIGRHLTGGDELVSMAYHTHLTGHGTIAVGEVWEHRRAGRSWDHVDRYRVVELRVYMALVAEIVTGRREWLMFKRLLPGAWRRAKEE